MAELKPLIFGKPDSRREAAGTGLDPHRLEADLRAALSGDVRFDAGSRALYATDASNYRQLPAFRSQQQTVTLAEFLLRQPERLAPVRLERRAVVHGHCHHAAVMGTDADREV